MKRILVLTALAVAAFATPAAATPINLSLHAVNGEGTYDDTIGCPGGDGPSWKYGWTGAAVGGPLAGAWSGIFEVHDSGAGAFMPPSTSRISLDLASGGTASFTLSRGSCEFSPLTLVRGAGNDATASGSLIAQAEFGTGAARGLIGSGVAQVDLGLSAGADNPATVQLSGDFEVRDPQLEVVSASSRWNRLADWLNKRLTVSVVVRNAGGSPLPGNAYGAHIVSASTNPATSGVSNVPIGTIPAGESRTATFTVNNAQPNKQYTLHATLGARDGLGGAVPQVNGSATFKSPLLFP